MKTKQICKSIPAMYTGFLPYLSPSLVTVAQPKTTPRRNVKPIRPTEMPEAHSKFSYTSKLCILDALSQSI